MACSKPFFHCRKSCPECQAWRNKLCQRFIIIPTRALKPRRGILKPQGLLRKRRSFSSADLANAKKRKSLSLIDFADVEITEILKPKDSTTSQETGDDTEAALAGEKGESPNPDSSVKGKATLADDEDEPRKSDSSTGAGTTSASGEKQSPNRDSGPFTIQIPASEKDHRQSMVLEIIEGDGTRHPEQKATHQRLRSCGSNPDMHIVLDHDLLLPEKFPRGSMIFLVKCLGGKPTAGETTMTGQVKPGNNKELLLYYRRRHLSKPYAQSNGSTVSSRGSKATSTTPTAFQNPRISHFQSASSAVQHTSVMTTASGNRTSPISPATTPAISKRRPKSSDFADKPLPQAPHALMESSGALLPSGKKQTVTAGRNNRPNLFVATSAHPTNPTQATADKLAIMESFEFPTPASQPAPTVDGLCLVLPDPDAPVETVPSSSSVNAPLGVPATTKKPPHIAMCAKPFFPSNALSSTGDYAVAKGSGAPKSRKKPSLHASAETAQQPEQADEEDMDRTIKELFDSDDNWLHGFMPTAQTAPTSPTSEILDGASFDNRRSRPNRTWPTSGNPSLHTSRRDKPSNPRGQGKGKRLPALPQIPTNESALPPDTSGTRIPRPPGNFGVPEMVYHVNKHEGFAIAVGPSSKDLTSVVEDPSETTPTPTRQSNARSRCMKPLSEIGQEQVKVDASKHSVGATQRDFASTRKGTESLFEDHEIPEYASMPQQFGEPVQVADAGADPASPRGDGDVCREPPLIEGPTPIDFDLMKPKHKFKPGETCEACLRVRRQSASSVGFCGGPILWADSPRKTECDIAQEKYDAEQGGEMRQVDPNPGTAETLFKQLLQNHVDSDTFPIDICYACRQAMPLREMLLKPEKPSQYVKDNLPKCILKIATSNLSPIAPPMLCPRRQYSASSIKHKESDVTSIPEEIPDDVESIPENLPCEVEPTPEEVSDDLCNVVLSEDVPKSFNGEDDFATWSKGLESLLDKSFSMEKSYHWDDWAIRPGAIDSNTGGEEFEATEEEDERAETGSTNQEAVVPQYITENGSDSSAEQEEIPTPLEYDQLAQEADSFVDFNETKGCCAGTGDSTQLNGTSYTNFKAAVELVLKNPSKDNLLDLASMAT